MNQNKRIIIIGGGPTGLGAAYHLSKLGYTNWALYEKNSYFGGHSSTHTDKQGFLWDEGGHVLFSHFKYFDDFVSEMLGKKFYRHQRESWIRFEDRWIPYPFQNNIRYLPVAAQLAAITGLIHKTGDPKKAKNFKDWILRTFGQGIAELFLFPYNFSVWATPLEKMSKDWMNERVSVVDLNRVLDNIISQKDDFSWGPNNTFLFPKYGGIREIYEQAAKKIKINLYTSKELAAIDPENKTLTFRDGSIDYYDYLINAMPIDKLFTIIQQVPSKLKKLSQKLTHNSIIIIGIGLKKQITTTKCWTYFPDPKVPFYRLTFFHNYSPYLVPNGDTTKYSSLMCEVSYSRYKKINRETVVDDTIQALIDNEIINESDRKRIIAKTVFDIPYGYPVPTLDRDIILRKLQPYLMAHQIYSRGRYGAWKYEISNMDHCFMQGVEAIDHILSKKKETVWTL